MASAITVLVQSTRLFVSYRSLDLNILHLRKSPGFLRAAKQHISFYRRSKMRDDEIHPDFRLGSAFDEVMKDFQNLGYRLSFDPENPKASLLNSADYGVPQKRIRFVLIGAREGSTVELPKPSHGAPDSKEVQEGVRRPWATLRDALKGLDSEGDEYVSFPEKWGQYLHLVPEGGCWRDLPEHLHAVVLGGAYDDGTDPMTAGMKGGRTGYLRRLSWDKPAPTLVDRPTNKANCLCHPDENSTSIGQRVRKNPRVRGRLDTRRGPFTTVPPDRPSHTGPVGGCYRC